MATLGRLRRLGFGDGLHDGLGSPTRVVSLGGDRERRDGDKESANQASGTVHFPEAVERVGTVQRKSAGWRFVGGSRSLGLELKNNSTHTCRAVQLQMRCGFGAC
jgi:hypothetical protein